MTRSRSLHAILPVLVLFVVADLGLPRASFGVERTFALNYDRIQIEQLLERVAAETRRSIIFDEQVLGNVSIVTKRPVTEDEAWAILNASLSLLGFTLLPSTVDNWRVAKLAEAVGEAPFAAVAGTTTDAFVTTLISFESADLVDVMPVLEPLSGSRVTLVPFEPTRSLIASGPETEIARLTTIADELDQIDEYELRLRVLRYRGVDEIEPLVEAWISSSGVSDRELQIWSDERTNSIVFRGNDDPVARLARYLAQLDRPIESEGEIQVLRVLNRDPEEVGELIRQLGQASQGGQAESTGSEEGAELAGADFVLAVDKPSRSLLVSADDATQIAIRKVLETLDEPPQLVAVDVTVSEIRTPSRYGLGFGFSLPFSTGNDDNDISGVIASLPFPGAATGEPSPGSQLFGRVTRDNNVPFTVDGVPILQSAVIDAGDSEAHTKVLIQPSLIVIAGESHEIFVGTNVPIPVTATEENPGSVSDLISQTTEFERTDLGIRLGIEVRAGHEGKIQLDLDVDISRLIPSLAGEITVVGPTYLTQVLEATARLDDGETAIVAAYRQKLGGDTESGVPWLSEIPFLGWLFKAAVDAEQDVHLVIATRARRISSPAEMVAESIRRRLTFQRSSARQSTLPEQDGSAFGVRVTTRQIEEDADAIAAGLARRGYKSVVHPWSLSGDHYFDVYVLSLESMADAAEVADALSKDGWEPDLVVLPTRS